MSLVAIVAPLNTCNTNRAAAQKYKQVSFLVF